MINRSTKNACGYDITSKETYTLAPGERKKISTGLFLNIPDNYWGLIKSRSSLAVAGIDVCGGVIDSDYKGEVLVILHNFSQKDYLIAEGARIAQIIFQKYYTPYFYANNVEREGGFGSTGI
jgi:dUTP pyrophosphatase